MKCLKLSLGTLLAFIFLWSTAQQCWASLDDIWWPTAGECGITWDYLIAVPREPMGPFAPWYDPRFALGIEARKKRGSKKGISKYRRLMLDLSQTSEVSVTETRIELGDSVGPEGDSGGSGGGSRRAGKTAFVFPSVEDTHSIPGLTPQKSVDTHFDWTWWVPLPIHSDEGSTNKREEGSPQGDRSSAPLPGSILLLSSGLVGLLCLRRKAHRRR